jgi:hypothetical protein
MLAMVVCARRSSIIAPTEEGTADNATVSIFEGGRLQNAEEPLRYMHRLGSTACPYAQWQLATCAALKHSCHGHVPAPCVHNSLLQSSVNFHSWAVDAVPLEERRLRTLLTPTCDSAAPLTPVCFRNVVVQTGSVHCQSAIDGFLLLVSANIDGPTMVVRPVFADKATADAQLTHMHSHGPCTAAAASTTCSTVHKVESGLVGCAST